MKKSLFALCVTLILCGCIPDPMEKDNKPSIEFNTSSAEMVIAMAREIEMGKGVNEGAWNELFRSPGYKNYLVYKDSIRKKELIKEALVTVFDASDSSKLDSLMNVPIKLGKHFLRLSLVQNFQSMKPHLNEMSRYLKETDFSKVLSQADSLAQAYLPTRVRSAAPDLYPVFVIVSDPDGRVQRNSIILDLNLMFELGTDGLIKFIAHEFHHNYREAVVGKFNDPLMNELNKLHQEAIADLIDKKKPPIKKLGLFPRSLVDEYNTDYLNTPNNLRTLDSLVVGYSSGEIEVDDFNSRIKGFFKFGGHTTGIYLSFLINEHIGKEPLIESFDNPVKFLSLYNSVAKGLNDEYILSDDFMRYIEFTPTNPENRAIAQ